MVLRTKGSIVRLLIPALVTLAGSGCGRSADVPRSRIGALPFPGLFTLYDRADPDRLGAHRYGRAPRLFAADESERGILYTVRAGFLDVAHVRMGIDWTRYCTAHLRDAIRDGAREVTLHGANRSLFHVTLNYPPHWQTLDPAEQQRVGDELALRAGQQLAYLNLTWHEVITWFGHRNVAFIDESPSAFTYDDVMSHVVGLRVADRAMRDPTRPYDLAVTEALATELAELGAVDPESTARAVRAVEGIWWAAGKPLKRHLDVGLASGVVRPWLVPGASATAGDDDEPETFVLPSLDDVCGHDLSGFYTVDIEPRIPEAARMRRLLPGRPRRFRHDRDLPALLLAARAQMQRRFAPDVDQPWPARTADDDDDFAARPATPPLPPPAPLAPVVSPTEPEPPLPGAAAEATAATHEVDEATTAQ